MVRCKTEMNDEIMDMALDLSLEMKESVQRRKNSTIALGLIAFVEIVWGVSSIIRRVSVSNIFMILLGIVVIVIMLNLKNIQRSTLRKMQKQMDPSLFSGIREYCFSEEGVHVKSQMGESMINWNAFRKFGTVGKYLYIERTDDRFVVVDQNNLSKEELQEVQQLLEKHVPAAVNAE